MKNAINYYYNLVTYDIHQVGKKYRFKVDEVSYLLCICEMDNEELEELYELNKALLQQKIYCHQIILNTSNGIITYINGEPYILMRIFVDDERKASFNDIILFNNLKSSGSLKKLVKINWRNFWMKKIDYFEYQISEFGQKYSLIRESFSYFIGLVETGISLLYNFNYSENMVLSHRRIKKGMSIFDLYNPLNFIIDSRVRNVAEFFKSAFFDKADLFVDIKEYLSKSGFNSYELYLFYARMFYPSFYFDIYEKVINESVSEDRLLNIINKVDSYEKLLHDLYWYLKPYVNLPNIEWIAKT